MGTSSKRKESNLSFFIELDFYSKMNKTEKEKLSSYIS